MNSDRKVPRQEQNPEKITPSASKKQRNYKTTPAPIRPFRLRQEELPNSDLRIELLPLIDIIFCILTFFLLAAVNFTRQQAIELDLPQAKTGTPQSKDMLIVTIDEIGQLYVEKQLVTRTLLSAYLDEYNQNNPNGLMVLYAEKNTTYREVVEVLDILREVGGDRVALATVPEAGETPNTPNTPQIPALEIPLLPTPPNPPQE